MNPKELEILVTGATGRQGGATARHLLKNGFRVRALTRDPEKGAAVALARAGAAVVRGDLDDWSSLISAMENCYGVFSVQNYWEGGAKKEIEQGIRVAKAARATGVRHLVYSSVGSAYRNTGLDHFESKWQIEEYIRAIDLPCSILRPVFFMQNWENYLREEILHGRLSQPLNPEKPLQQINVDDIGAFAAMAFLNPKLWLGRELDLAGDELTMPQVAQVFSRVMDRPVEYVQVEWEQFEKAMGPEMTAMYRWFDEIGYEADIEGLRDEFPQLSTIEDTLKTGKWREWARQVESRARTVR